MLCGKEDKYDLRDTLKDEKVTCQKCLDIIRGGSK
jgi:hypothetical protein